MTKPRVLPDASIYSVPKVDCHCHILDPQGFAYAADVSYQPAGQETGSADYFEQVLDAYGVQHALLVGPNSGYGVDNRCLLAAIAASHGRFKGIAVVPHDASSDCLEALKAQGICGWPTAAGPRSSSRAFANFHPQSFRSPIRASTLARC